MGPTPKRKMEEGGGDADPLMSPIKSRLRCRASFAETEGREPHLIGIIEGPNKGKKKRYQPELKDDFTAQDLADPDPGMGNAVGEENYVPRTATPENKFKHEDKGVDVDEMTEEHEGTIRSEDEHVGGDGDKTGSQHLLMGGTTAAERAEKILSILKTAKKDVSEILTAGNQEDEKNAEILLSTIHAKDEEITKLNEELRAAIGQVEFLQGKVNSNSSRVLQFSSKIASLELDLQNRTADDECKGLKKVLDEEIRENENLEVLLHAKNADLERQTRQTTLLEEKQIKLIQENSRIGEKLEAELKKKTSLYDNTVSYAISMEQKLKSQDGKIRGFKEEIGGFKEEIQLLNAENDHLSKSLIPKLDKENKRLQKENANLRRTVTEKNGVIELWAVENEGLQKSLKTLEDDAIARRAELVASRKLDENSKKQQEDAKREIDLLKTAILEKDKELAPLKAKYLVDQEGNSQLHLAVKEGDEQAVADLLALEADANSRNYNGDTPIILAASSGGGGDVALKIIKLLIEHGADVFATDKKGQTFLHKFLSNENENPPTSAQFQDILNVLVSKNLTSLFNIRDTYNGTTPFMLAARNVDLDMATISLLQTNGVEFNRGDYTGRSYLSYAAEAEGNKNVDLLLQLNRYGMSTNHRNLAQAIKSEDEDSVILLVWRGDDVNEMSHDSQTPLQLAAKSRNTPFSINTIKLLISYGANVDVKDKHGFTFLHQFVDAKHSTIHPEEFHELAFFLCSKNRSMSRLFNISNNAGITPFHLAVQDLEIDTATLHLLKESGVNINAVNNIGLSALCYAILSNRSLRLIMDLVTFGANPKHLTSCEESMLHLAACTGRLELLNFLMDQGLDVNARNWCGKTALHCALQQRRESAIETVQFLVCSGANPDIADDKGKSARDYFNENRDSYPEAEAEQISTCFSLGSVDSSY